MKRVEVVPHRPRVVAKNLDTKFKPDWELVHQFYQATKWVAAGFLIHLES